MTFPAFDSYQEVPFDIRRHCYEYAYGPHIRDAVVQDVARHMRVRLTLELFTREARKVVEFEPVSYPKTWWDAFKLAHFPKWAIVRWPAEFEVVRRPPVVVEAEALLPEVAPMKNQHRVIFAIRQGRDGL